MIWENQSHFYKNYLEPKSRLMMNIKQEIFASGDFKYYAAFSEYKIQTEAIRYRQRGCLKS